jgi:hypothetical protein
MSAPVVNPPLNETVTLRWSGRLPRFASLREGGPGKPSSLMIWLGITLVLGWWGVRLIDRQGIDSGGPAMVFIAAALLLFLVLWLVIKATLRGLDVTFSVNEKGIEIIPSAKQQALDQGMRIVSLVTFWLTLKGGQWARWHPLTPWKQVRSVEIDEIYREILIRGGAWDIRLVDLGDRFETVCQVIRERAPKRTRIVQIGING